MPYILIFPFVFQFVHFNYNIIKAGYVRGLFLKINKSFLLNYLTLGFGNNKTKQNRYHPACSGLFSAGTSFPLKI